MQERKLNILVAGYPYGGVGGSASLHPNVSDWTAKAVMAATKDPRVEHVWTQQFSSTPITMTRNKSVVKARQLGADILIMIDSDMAPDIMLGQDQFAKPFFESSFDFVYKHWDKGPSVVCSPYCGPPTDEPVYVMKWVTGESDCPDNYSRLQMYEREEAAQLSGITPVAGQPTGLIMFDMRAFDLIEPYDGDPLDALRSFKEGKINEREVLRMLRGNSFFYYEFCDHYQQELASTEDMTCTRDISLHGLIKLGYSPIYCNWDSWSGHWKPKCVTKPKVLFVDTIGEKLQRAVLTDCRERERLQEVRGVDIGISTPKHDLDALKKLVGNYRGGVTGSLTIVEVGSWVGRSSGAIADVMGDAVLWCVDTWAGSEGDVTRRIADDYGQDNLFKMWESNVGRHGYPDRIHAVRGFSKEVAATWTKPIDFLFLDADHFYESVRDDIEAWYPHVKLGGIIAGHDYGVKQFPGVKKAVDEKFGSIKRSGTIWWVMKPPRVNASEFNDLGVSVISNTDLDALRSLVKSLVNGDGYRPHVAEVGSWVGTSAIAMADAGANVMCIDTWNAVESDADIMGKLYDQIGPDRVFETFKKNVGHRLIDSISYDRDYSLAAAQRTKNKYDMVFIDASHDYESVKADIEAWYPKIRAGGIIAGHDYSNNFPDVKRAVDERFGNRISTRGDIWWCAVESDGGVPCVQAEETSK